MGRLVVPELGVDLCGGAAHPLILASGILGTEAELLARNAGRAGAVTAKSCSLEPRRAPQSTVLG